LVPRVSCEKKISFPILKKDVMPTKWGKEWAGIVIEDAESKFGAFITTCTIISPSSSYE
jgi:hypothetical protein